MPCKYWKYFSTIFVLLLFTLFEKSLAACSFNNGYYFAQWTLDNDNNVHIQIQFQDFPSSNAWTGIAFGELMYDGLDAIIIKVINGKVNITDEYVQGYRPSWPDKIQNVQVYESNLTNGVLTVYISRPVFGDNLEDHSLEGCTTWQFITGPGKASDNHVGRHTKTPTINRVCIDECRV